MTKVKIKSDGTGPGTVIYINGERIENVGEVTWHLRTSGLAEVRIKLVDVDLDVDGQVAMKFEGPVKIPTAVELLQQIAPKEFARIVELVGTNDMGAIVAGMAEGIRENLIQLEKLTK